MKALAKALGILFFSTTVLPGLAADPSQCSSISNNDQRQMCGAVATGSTSECGFIQEKDLRQMCLAQVGRRKSECGFINDAGLRAQCNATAG